jgi:hypothetical protein
MGQRENGLTCPSLLALSHAHHRCRQQLDGLAQNIVDPYKDAVISAFRPCVLGTITSIQITPISPIQTSASEMTPKGELDMSDLMQADLYGGYG